jgi:hypothetical protein
MSIGDNILAKVGFSGVEIHAGHGYLVSSFLSPKTNRRKDEYGGIPNDRMKFLFRIIDAIRAIVPQTFVLGVKLNSADFSTGGLTEYQSRSERTHKREAYFIEFIGKVRNVTKIPLIVTGGCRWYWSTYLSSIILLDKSIMLMNMRDLFVMIFVELRFLIYYHFQLLVQGLVYYGRIDRCIENQILLLVLVIFVIIQQTFFKS